MRLLYRSWRCERHRGWNNWVRSDRVGSLRELIGEVGIQTGNDAALNSGKSVLLTRKLRRGLIGVGVSRIGELIDRERLLLKASRLQLILLNLTLLNLAG